MRGRAYGRCTAPPRTCFQSLLRAARAGDSSETSSADGHGQLQAVLGDRLRIVSAESPARASRVGFRET